MTNFVDSQYRFTNPIRFFKANDPIYFEVDNIPLKQLQENDLWLKDQLTSVSATAGTVGRSTFTELQPYTDGVDNTIKVRPGRFTARINDAYEIEPLQVITRLAGESVSANDFNTWLARSINYQDDLSNILEKFKQEVALNLNGLVERCFTWPTKISDKAASEFFDNQSPRILYINGTSSDSLHPPYPGIGATLWGNFSGRYVLRQFDATDRLPATQTTIGFARLPAAETAFIKKWRGIARTAIVDIPEELSITIPAFDSEDFYYYDEAGVKNYLTEATHRIDLLFVYSKPIDSSSVTVDKFVNGEPTKLNSPQLGIVYGAGIGVDFKRLDGSINKILSPVGAQIPGTTVLNSIDESTLPDGTRKMLAHFGDQAGTNTGLAGVKGSFPAPDDLMNLSPLLDEELNSDSFALIGQTVLPLAYVVVKRSANINGAGAPIITSDDVIDIRPFFRTAELSYNERAGIAAAVPAISLANPVASQAELNYEIIRLRQDILQRIPILTDPGPTAPAFTDKTYTDIPYITYYPGGNSAYDPNLSEVVRFTPLFPTYTHDFNGTITQPKEIIMTGLGVITDRIRRADPNNPNSPHILYPLSFNLTLDIYAREARTCEKPITVYGQILGSNVNRINDKFCTKMWTKLGVWTGGNGDSAGEPKFVSYNVTLPFHPLNDGATANLIPLYGRRTHEGPWTLRLYLCEERLLTPESGNTLAVLPTADYRERRPLNLEYTRARGANNPLIALTTNEVRMGYRPRMSVFEDPARARL